MEKKEGIEQTLQKIKNFLKVRHQIDLSERQECCLRLSIEQDKIFNIINEQIIQLNENEINDLKYYIGYNRMRVTTQLFNVIDDQANRKFQTMQNQPFLELKQQNFLQIHKSEEFKNNLPPFQKINATAQYNFQRSLQDFEYVIFDQEKDEQLDQSPFKIICKSCNIDRLLKIKNLDYEKKNQVKLQIIGFYGDYDLSKKIIDQLFPQLKLMSYESNSYPKQDQVVAYSVMQNSGQQDTNNEQIKKTIVLVYKENKNNKSKTLTENEDSIQLIRYMLDVSHVFVTVIPQEAIENWKDEPSFKQDFENTNTERIKSTQQFDSSIKFQLVTIQTKNVSTNLDLPLQKVLNSQFSLGHSQKIILTDNCVGKSYIVVQVKKEKKFYSKSDLEKIFTDIQTIRLHFDQEMTSVLNSNSLQEEKIQKIKSLFEQMMEKVKQKFYASKQSQQEIEGIKQNLFDQLQNFKVKFQKSEGDLILEKAQEICKNFQENMQFNKCCSQRKQCDQNQCQSLYDMIINSIHVLQSSNRKYNDLCQVNDIHEQNLLDQQLHELQEYLCKKYFNQNLFNTLINKFLQEIKILLQNEDLMVTKEDKIRIYSKLFQITLEQCHNIEHSLLTQGEIKSCRDIFSSQLLDKIKEQVNKLEHIMLNYTYLYVNQANVSQIQLDPIKICLPPQTSNIVNYFAYNNRYDFFVTTTYSNEEFPEDSNNLLKDPKNCLTQIWRYNKQKTNNLITLQVEYIKTSLLLNFNPSTNQWIVFDKDDLSFQIGSISQQGVLLKGKSFSIKEYNERNENDGCNIEVTNIQRVFVQNDQIYIFDSSNVSQVLKIENFKRVNKLFDQEEDQYEMINGSDDLFQKFQFQDVLFLTFQNKIFFGLIEEGKIKVYNVNQKLQYEIDLPHSDIKIKDIKLINDKESVQIIILRQDNSIDFYYQPSKGSDSSCFNKDVSNQILKEQKGNIIIDRIAQSLYQFGDKSKDSFVINNSKIYFYWEKEGLSKVKMQNYINHNYFQNLFQKNFKNVEKQFLEGSPSIIYQIKENLMSIKNEELVSDVQLEYCLKTRVPIQISTFKNFEYQSLKDGLLDLNQVYQGRITVQDMKKTIQLGWYEQLINKKQQLNTHIISIFGEQSIGKSSQLNRLFNSRFGTSAARCTDGIWMSLSQIDDKNQIILLDCEGIFSQKRTDHEELILMQQISMVSDIQILFTSLNGLNRNHKHLLQYLQSCSERIKSKEYYQGKLILLTKGISNEQQKQEILEQYDQELEAEIFLKEQIQYLFLPDFTNSTFNKQLNDVRNLILDKIKKSGNLNQKSGFEKQDPVIEYTSDEDLQFENDFISTKFNVQNEKLDLIKYSFCQLKLKDDENLRLIKYEEKMQSLKKYFEEQIVSFKFDSNQHVVQIINEENNKKYSINQNKIEFILNSQKGQEINQNISKFFDLLEINLLNKDELLIEKRIKFIENVARQVFNDRFQKLEQFILRQTTQDQQLESFNKQLSAQMKELSDQIIESITFCKEKCNQCQNMCLLTQNHSNQHFCFGIHLQLERKNLCSENCSDYKYCERKCASEIGHINGHRCNDKSCHNKCQLCNKRCILELGHKQSYHLCDSEHQCSESCEKQGICNILYEQKSKIFKNKNEKSINYNQYDQISNFNKCNLSIPKGQLKHEGTHECSNYHRCDHTCPDCGAYCELTFGHTRYHESTKHRNLKSHIGIYNKSINEIIIRDEKENTERIYSDGDQALPEVCNQQCQRLGRGHTHFIFCEEGEQCAQRIYGQQFARHSNKEINGQIYDELTCEKYWEHLGWLAPLQDKISQQQFNQNKLCNWACSSETHQINQNFNYCKLKLWHEGGHDINFNKEGCKHLPPSKTNNQIDICFTIDTTGSMQWAVDQVKEVIQKLVSSFNLEQNSLKVAIVGYRDHPPEAQEYVTKIYSNLDDPKQVLEKMNEIEVDEGGDTPEAVIDGLLTTGSEIKWRQLSAKYVFHIFDAPPHGKNQYGIESKNWNNGCPCNKTINDVFTIFKKNNIQYHMIQCSKCLEQTKEVFQSTFGNLFLGCITIKQAEQREFFLSTKIQDIIAKQILNNQYFFYQVKNN